MIEINKHKYTFPKILTFGFLIVIFMGTILLSLPFATRPGETTNFMTAFFTSTSATCVTGLTLVSTAHHWTLFGQIVIAILMEVGGLGFMTFAVMMSLLVRQRMRMSTRLLTQEALNLDHLSQLNVVYLIIRLSLLIQLAGGIFLFLTFIRVMDLAREYGLVFFTQSQPFVMPALTCLIIVWQIMLMTLICYACSLF